MTTVSQSRTAHSAQKSEYKHTGGALLGLPKLLDKAGIRKRCMSTVQSSGMSSWAVSVCIVAVLASAVDAWICDITLIGNSTEPQSLTFSKAAVNCTRDDRDPTPTLQVRIHPFLQSATLEGDSSCDSNATYCCFIRAAAVDLLVKAQLSLPVGSVSKCLAADVTWWLQDA